MNYTLDSLFGVKDEVIVVCGGTRGIGREIANGLADLGAKLAIVATKQPACDQAAEELKARGAQDAIAVRPMLPILPLCRPHLPRFLNIIRQ